MRGGFIYQIFKRIGPPRRTDGNPTACQHILMQWTEQAGQGRGPPEVSIILEYMGIVLGAQLVQKTGEQAHHETR